jgi:FMN phosphatase YigB (HAD superfamily)
MATIVDAVGAGMIGDNLDRDVDGALAAGLRAVWINRAGLPRPPGRDDLVEIRDLHALPAVLSPQLTRRSPRFP